MSARKERGKERRKKGQPNTRKESDENRLGCSRIVGRDGRDGHWRGRRAPEHGSGAKRRAGRHTWRARKSTGGGESDRDTSHAFKENAPQP